MVAFPPIAEVCLSNEGIRSLRGIARINLRYAGKRLKVKQAIALAKPGFIRLETFSFLDQPLLIVATDGVNLQAVSLPENRFYRGTVAAGLSRFIHLTMSSEEFVSLILGEIPRCRSAVMGYDLSRRLFTLTFPPSSRWERETYWVHPETLRVVAISKADASKREAFRVVFSRFKKAGSRTFPMLIQIEAPGDENRIELYFRTTEINASLPRDLFSLAVPPGLEVVDMDETIQQSPLAFPEPE
jgi:hypothetical protein